MRFLDAFAPGKSIAALRIPHKGTSTEQRECPRCKTRLESNYAVFSGAIRRTKLLPRSVFRTREHPQSSGSARGGKARLELNSAVFSGAMRRTKLLPRSVFRTREHPQSSGGARGARPASNQIMRFFRRNAPNKASAALRIPPQGNIHRAAGALEGARPASNWILRFSPAQCAEQSFCRTPYSAQGNIHRAAGALEGARPASNWIMRFFRRKAPEKPPRSYGNGGCNTHMTAQC